MKNVFLVLFFLSAFSIVGLQAQNCTPCPPGCCMVAAKNASATNQTMPETFDILAAYPTAKTVGYTGAKCTPAEVAACKPLCTPGKAASASASAPQCKPAASVALQPSGCQPAASVALQPSSTPQCQPAASKTLQPSTAAIQPQSNQAPKPMKG
jgi:hypothetical protein